MNPQKGNGYTPIANEIMEALARTHLPSSDFRCLLYIIRKTYGYHKKTDQISLNQFSQATGLKTKHVSRSLRSLEGKNIMSIL